MKKRLILIIFLALFCGVGGLVYWGQGKKRSAELYYSGTIEATQANLAFQVNGMVKKILVDEGHWIETGQLLAVLDQDTFSAIRDQAQANLNRTRKSLSQTETMLEVNRRTLPAEVERAEAAVEMLRAQLAELEAGYRTQEIEQSRLAVEEARIAFEKARKDQTRFDRLYKSHVVSEKDKDAADLRYETSLKEYLRAMQALNLRKEGHRKESIEAARARLTEAQAALKLARSNLKRIEAFEMEVQAAEAQVQAAQAAYDLTSIQLAYAELKSPFGGVVVSRNIEPGEVVSAGQEVLSIADLSEVDLKVFVEETEIGKIKPGQKVDVKIDTFPSKTYIGRVSFISPEGEFTPKIIQTHKERVKLVYLVKITIPNPESELKTGMPADAWFR